LANKLRFLYFLPSFLWAGLIFALSTNNPAHLPKFKLLSWDKLGHLVFYAVLTLLLCWAVHKSTAAINANNQSKFWLLMVILASVYGAFLEFVQASLPYRSFDYADMLANCLGAVLAIVAWAWLLRHKFIRF
jgi:VanZ family protein